VIPLATLLVSLVPVPQDGVQAPATPPAAEPAPAVERPYALRGSLRLRERSRWSAGEHDHDLYTALYLDGGEAEHDAWTWRVSARAERDLDGAADPDSDFFSLDDAQGEGAELDLYEAWAERHDAPEFEALRVGRQTDYQTPVFAWFDGLSARTRVPSGRHAQLGGYAGRSVRPFEEEYHGDLVLGLWSEHRPWERARLRIDWMHLEDEQRLGEGADDLVQLALGQALGERWRFDASWSRLENANRDLSLRTLWADPERDTSLSFYVYRLLEPQETLAFELDPLTSALLVQEPFTQLRLTASQGFSEHLHCDLGVDLRRLAEGVDESEFNHDVDRAWLTASLLELPWDCELSLTGELWDSGTDDLSTWSADLTKHLDERHSLALGTSYALYAVDLLTITEREDVRTTYLRWREKRREGWSFDVAFEHEEQPGDDLDNLRVGGTWSF